MRAAAAALAVLCRIYSVFWLLPSWLRSAMDGRTRVAWNLRRIRVERGLSQEALAVDADVDRTYVSGIERGSFNPDSGLA